jgi:hypothetical protein
MLGPRSLLSAADSLLPSSSSSLLRSQLFNRDFPFPYDDQFFECAERIYNVRPVGGRNPGCRANLNLVLKPGKKLDIQVLAAESLEGLANTKDVFTFYGVENILDAELSVGDVPRLFYQVLHREGSGAWKALSPKSVKLPTVSLENGGEIKVILIADDHTFDDADYVVPAGLAGSKLSGDYVNDLLRGLRFNPSEVLNTPLRSLRSGFCLASTLRYIMANEDPDLIIHLGDTNGIGAGYKWPGLGLPAVGLTDKDYDYISHLLWLRMRKIYSAVTPHVPMYIAQGNHDGEEQWNPLRFRARQWRQQLFAMPDDRTYPEGGHPDGIYYAFSWGSDQNYRGGVRFIALHTTAFAGDAYPRTPEGWTLGETQREWFERMLQLGEKHWVFACFHHALGGWPAGSGEENKEMAYGRGPLFTASDYLPYADSARVEQVKLTDMGRNNGLRAFLYGHDHIFFHKSLPGESKNKEMLAVCCGSPKYMGELGWWNGPLWMANYGTYLGPTPRFWGPPGITRLTIRKDEAIIDYIVTAFSPYTNHPANAEFGTILSSRRLLNPPPSLVLERQELSFQAVEGQKSPPPEVLRIRNKGSGALRYKLKTHVPWLVLSASQGESWGEWDEIKVHVRTVKVSEGVHEGKISLISNDPSAGSSEITVKLTVGSAPLSSIRGFSGANKEITESSLTPETPLTLNTTPRKKKNLL